MGALPGRPRQHSRSVGTRWGPHLRFGPYYDPVLRLPAHTAHTTPPGHTAFGTAVDG